MSAPTGPRFPAAVTHGPMGAHYHKVETLPSTSTVGISASVTLGHFKADPSRPPLFVDPHGKLQDVMSNYLGTSATAKIAGKPVNAESDVGFATSRNFDARGRPAFVPAAVQLSGERPSTTFFKAADGTFRDSTTDKPYAGTASELVPHFASRAFVRVNEPVLDAAGRVQVGPQGPTYQNYYLNLPPGDPSQYAYRGETLKMTVERQRPPASGKNMSFDFTVARADGTTTSGGLKWSSPVLGLATAAVTVKRVSSIDLRDNEGKPAKPTRATVTDVVWNSALMLTDNAKVVPMVGSTVKVIHGSDSVPGTFKTGAATKTGGERVSIDPPDPR